MRGENDVSVVPVGNRFVCPVIASNGNTSTDNHQQRGGVLDFIHSLVGSKPTVAQATPTASPMELRSRVAMEMHRCKRHDRPLMVVALRLSVEEQSLESIACKLITQLRMLDIVVVPPPGSEQPILIICPESNQANEAHGFSTRLAKILDNNEVATGYASYPQDGDWFSDLAQAAIARMEKSAINTASTVTTADMVTARVVGDDVGVR